MNNFLKSILQIFLSTLILFIFLEVVFRFIGVPGSSDFVEKIVIRENLTPKKSEGEIRIFTYGESTMHGAQYGPVASPAKWLDIYLRDYLPGKNIRLINFSRIGRGSDFILKTFRDTLVYQPDLAIFYLGHNDFLHGNRKDHVVAKKSKPAYRIKQILKKSYFLSSLHRLLLRWKVRIKGETEVDKIEYDTIETPPTGIGIENATPHTEPFYWENIEFLRNNLVQMIRLGKKRNLPLLFYKPVSNLKDFAPFHSMHLKELTPEELEEWERLYAQGQEFEKQGKRSEALKAYLRAYTIDDTYADLSFRLGKFYLKELNTSKARRFFEEARDNDTIIFRATRDILDLFMELQEEGDLILIDTEEALRDTVPGGILGEPIIEDNVHFSLQGQALIAQAAALEIAKRGWIAPERSFRWNNIRPFDTLVEEIGIDEDFLLSVYLKMVNYFGSRFENRIRFAKKALELDPLNSRALRYLAWTYWLMGEREEAIAIYRNLALLSPEALEEVFQAQPEIKSTYAEFKQTLPA